MNKLELHNFRLHYFHKSKQENGKVENTTRILQKQAQSLNNWALGPLNFSIASGERVGVLGASGAGKSSLLHAIVHRNLSLLDMYCSGIICKPEQTILSVMQESKFVLNPLRTVYAAFRVLYKSEKSKLQKPLSKQEICYYLSLMELDNIEAVLHARPYQLSGGMAQRVMFALVLALNPDWVLADELSASLDMLHEEKILKVLFKEVPSVIMVTHNLALVEKYCQRVLFLAQGQLIYDGTAQGLYKSSNTVIQQYLDNVYLSRNQVTSLGDKDKK